MLDLAIPDQGAGDVIAAEPHCGGTIRVITPVPVAVAANPGPIAMARTGLRRRPWIVPVALIVAAAAYALSRRSG